MALTDEKRKWVALAVLGILALLTWQTLDPGRTRTVVLVVLGAFAFRILLTPRRSRYDEKSIPGK
ncbi:hypothetical protein [Silvibacterium dinghuense]|uniref:Uncharacterized protein n=2 Tax=Silvibacterium dinghuense TaxID=1560006 RepID=A0A4Q1SKN6_9BACT|nr:hypothetical protein [Silvibacterium dinghuense]RXS98045.1 hypothetical protein ESZ00_09475 [Silvibacterium dinghuense]GGH04074.1 hypothetical protein GCM10011586_20120 [Silvibacterium dinghuense]